MYHPPLLNIENASVVRGEKIVLDNLSLRIDDGEHTAIVGPNGSGKSTLIKLITRQLYPLAGQDRHPVVEIFGRERWDVFALRSLLGILSNDLHQDFAADPDLEGTEVVLSGFFSSKGLARHHEVTDQMRTAAERAIALAGADAVKRKRLAAMSTGEARRILIARCLVSRPRALLLDEPTAGLDIAARRHFLQSIRQIARDNNTVILVTHHVEEIIPEIQRVILVKDGTVYLDGLKRDVLTSDALSSLFDEPIEVRESGGYYSAEIELVTGGLDKVPWKPTVPQRFT